MQLRRALLHVKAFCVVRYFYFVIILDIIISVFLNKLVFHGIKSNRELLLMCFILKWSIHDKSKLYQTKKKKKVSVAW